MKSIVNNTTPQAEDALLSIVVPCHNEQAVLTQTCERIRGLAKALAEDGVACELVFINDGSTDDTATLLDEFASHDTKMRVVHLTRNFGHQAAVSAGLELSRGDVVAVLDADLQDPPEVLPAMLEKWRAGYQVVYGVREKRKEGPVKRAGYWAFYRLLRLASDLEIPMDAGDFCVMDRSAVDLINQLPERQRFLRGLRHWVGLKQVGVPYERDARQAGTPSYNLRALVKLASDGLVSFSVAPLRLTTRLGTVGVAVAFILGLWVVGSALMQTDTPRGWASLACLILLLSSIQLVSLGILGEYMARVFLEVKGRPTYLVGRITQQEEGTRENEAPEEQTIKPTITITQPLPQTQTNPQRQAG